MSETEDAAPIDRSVEPREIELTAILVPLLKGVIYRELDAPLWSALLKLQARVRDYVAVLGLVLVLDEAEGYAFLRARDESEIGRAHV